VVADHRGDAWHGTPRQPVEEGDTFVQTLRVFGQLLP
jgi:hypothetical protein